MQFFTLRKMASLSSLHEFSRQGLLGDRQEETVPLNFENYQCIFNSPEMLVFRNNVHQRIIDSMGITRHQHNFTDIFYTKKSDEPIQMIIDLTTGHLILSYMEEHLRDRDRLSAEWETICAYESDDGVICEESSRSENALKNRTGCPLPYERTRVKLINSESDYINASLMYDHDPRKPIYIAAITPLVNTVCDFWKMIWEQSSVNIVCLDPLVRMKEPLGDTLSVNKDSDVSTLVRYWPLEGCAIFGNFEVRLISEHRCCNEYVIRSLYLKNIENNETRTITQFHFLTWLDEVPRSDLKILLEFRRKINKSFRPTTSPLVVHCVDGCGRTGTYLLLDLVLNRISKGIKELDVTATLEHLRDQRQSMVRFKEQFEVVLASIAEEVKMMLSATK